MTCQILCLCVSLALSTDDPMFLVFKRGDLLLVEKDEQSSPDKNWFRATNQRTSSSGAVYKDAVQFLPTLNRPTEEMLVELPLFVIPFNYLLKRVTCMTYHLSDL